MKDSQVQQNDNEILMANHSEGDDQKDGGPKKPVQKIAWANLNRNKQKPVKKVVGKHIPTVAPHATFHRSTHRG